MRLGPSIVIQGALFGSFLIAAFGMMVTQSVHAQELLTAPPAAVAAVEPEPDAPTGEEAAASVEDLFEASIAYTPEEAPAVFPSGEGQGLCDVSESFSPNILQWCELITRYSEEHGFSPDLIAALIVQESGGAPAAYSRSGAVGLMQVMPRDGIASTFNCINGPCFANRPTIEELKDPEYNIAYGTRMLAGLYNRFGNIRDALKSYGPMDVGYTYADKVLAIYERHRQ